MRAWLFAIGGLLLLCGCPPKRYEFGPDTLRDPAEVLLRVEAARARPQRLSGEARVRLETPQGRFGADHFVVAALPDSARLETLSFFGNPLALMLMHEGNFLLWDLERAVAYVGPATAQTLGMMVPVGLGPEAVVGVLLGQPPLLEGGRARLDLDHERRLYVVRLELDELARQDLFVDPTDLTLREVHWYERGRLVGRLFYDRYEAREGGLFPGWLRYEAEGDAAVEVRWRELALDPAQLPDGVFTPELPEGVRQVQVGGGAPTEAPQVLPPEAE